MSACVFERYNNNDDDNDGGCSAVGLRKNTHSKFSLCVRGVRQKHLITVETLDEWILCHF